MKRERPLGLPRGSVRAIIALAFVGTTLALIAVAVVRQDGQINAALAALLALVGPIVKDYFGDRTASDDRAPVDDGGE